LSSLIVTEFMTLDGVVEAPGGEPTHPHAGWVMDFAGPEQMEFKLAEVLDAESLLIGRVTYEGFSAAWPERDGEFADKMNGMPKYVVSSTLTEPLAWENSTVIAGDVAAEVTRLKQEGDGPILVAGSATLVRFLLEQGLVDELRLMVFPVLVGGGLRCFPDSRLKQSFRLGESTTFPSGVAVHSYHPAG
jgi:dihydrofolate reductase